MESMKNLKKYTDEISDRFYMADYYQNDNQDCDDIIWLFLFIKSFGCVRKSCVRVF